MRYVDFAYGRPGAQNILNAGFPGVLRYASRTTSKNLDLAEYQDYISKGVLTHIVYQDGIADHNGGTPAGSDNASRAKIQALNLGWDGHTGCIYFAPFDANETTATVPLTLAYFRGIRQVLNLENIGVYGDTDTINAVRQANLATYFWQSASTSFGPDVECNIHQLPQQTTINGVVVDINNVLKFPTGAINGGNGNSMSNQDEVRSVLNEATAEGFDSFAHMFNAPENAGRGIVALLRDIYNATVVRSTASSDQVGLVGENISNLRDDIARLEIMIAGLTSPGIDYQKLAQALIAELKAL